ncbi:hypothetical protein K3495_g14283 [Podosphaera aphanis]|nr:hypothetical protein K3495_g14283 [Podosphaera aphanis]
MTAVANVPAIFVDSHPDEQESYLMSWLSSIRSTLTIAATGVVERAQQVGDLRLKWYTHDGNVGFKDYPLQGYQQARSDFDEVLALPDVRRAMILGYPAQNPYITIDGKNPWVDRFEREKKLQEKMHRDQLECRGRAKDENFLDIYGLVEETEKAEMARIVKEQLAEETEIREAIQTVQGGSKGERLDEEKGFLSRQRV